MKIHAKFNSDASISMFYYISAPSRCSQSVPVHSLSFPIILLHSTLPLCPSTCLLFPPGFIIIPIAAGQIDTAD